MRILGGAAIPDFREANDECDDPGGMLDLGPHGGLGAILPAFDFVDLPLYRYRRLVKSCARRAQSRITAVGPVCLIAIDAGFVPMQQVWQHRRVRETIVLYDCVGT